MTKKIILKNTKLLKAKTRLSNVKARLTKANIYCQDEDLAFYLACITVQEKIPKGKGKTKKKT